MSSRALAAGDLIAGRFAIERLAGEGGMGAVFRATDGRTGQPVAIKVVRAGADATRFAREAEILSEVVHPHIVRYVAHGVEEGLAYLAMEWLEGEGLDERLVREGLSIRQSVALAAHVARALGAAHERGIVHRDIKPSNLLLVEGDVERVKVLDFGIARPRGARQVTRTGVIVGTPGYLSPEQARGHESLDPRTDVFSLGCVLFECLTGRPAFLGEHAVALLAQILLEDPPRASTLRAGVRGDVDDLLRRMLAKDPADRPADGGRVAAELSRLEAVQTGDDRPAGVAPARPSLTLGEQRVLSVVLLRSARRTEDAPDSAYAATVANALPGAWLDEIGAKVAAHGAHLNPLADGSLLVTILGTAAATDTAAQAARCALALRDAAPGEPVALATGRGAVSGHVAIGDVVSSAVRLLAAAPSPRGEASHVRVDEVTAGLLDARFEIRGDAAGLELVREREQVQDARTLLGKPTPCVGREREIGMLLAMFEECVAEPVASCTLVTGPAGVGKSRVRHELLGRLAGRCEVWRASGDTVGRGAPFGLVAAPIRRAAGIQSGEPIEVARRKLAARVARNVTRDRARVTAFLGELIGVPAADERETPELEAARADGIVMGDQIRRAWQEFLAAETSAAPVVLVLEDLHLGDLPSVKLVDLALRNLRERPFMVLALARPEVAEVFPDLWRDRGPLRIELGSLTRRASEKLVRSVLGEIDEARMSRILERAAGNAFYLEETLRAEAEGKGDGLPPTVLAMVQSRLEELDPGLRRALRAASVFGRLFWTGGVAAMLDGWSGFDAAMLDRLEEHELVARLGEGRFPGQQEYAFRHTVFREAAYAMLTDTDRALAHRLAAEWLEGAGEPDAAILADHWERGGVPARAVPFYVRAAQQALEGNDFATTIEHARRGARCGAQGQELVALSLLEAEAHRWSGGFESALACATRARAGAEVGSSAWLSAQALIVDAHATMGHVDAADGESKAALANARPESFDEQVHVFGRITGIAGAVGVYATARAAYGAAEAAFDRSSKSLAVRSWIERARSVVAALDGDIVAVVEGHDATARAAKLAGDLRHACLQAHNAADTLKELGDLERAEQLLRPVVAESERLGLPLVLAASLNSLGFVLARRGQREEALTTLRRGIDESERSGYRRIEGFGRVYLATALAESGDLPAALDQAQRAVELFASTAPPVEPLARAVLARVLLRQGRSKDALEQAGRAMAGLESFGAVEEGEASIRVAYAEALLASDREAEAREVLAVAEERLRGRAAKIRDEARRRLFFSVPEHARTLELLRRA